MAVFELQITIPTFLVSQLRSLQSRRICPSPPYVVGDPSLNISIQMQRIIFGRNSIRHNRRASIQILYSEPRLNPVKPYLVPTPNDATGFSTHIAQELELLFTLTSDILEHPNQPPANIISVPLTLVAHFSYYSVDTGGCVIKTTFDHVEWGRLPELPPGFDPTSFQKLLEKELESKFDSPAAPFDFVPIGLLPPDVIEIANAGVSVDEDLQRIAFRVDPAGGDTNNDLRWTPFYSGRIPDRLQGADWALFIDGKLLEALVSNSIDRALKRKPQAKLKVNSVGGEYSNAGNVPQVRTTISAFIDAPVIAPVYIDPSILTVFSLETSPNNLVVDVHLDEIQALINVARDVVRVLEIFVPPLGAVADLLLGDIGGALHGIEPPQFGSFACTKVSDVHYRCTLPAPVPSIPGAQLRLSAIAALTDGLSLSGNLIERPFTPSVLQTNPGEFEWQLPGFSCSMSDAALRNIEENPTDVLILRAVVELTHSGTEPVYLCGVELLNAQLLVFPNARFDRELLPTWVMVTMKEPGPSYRADPYAVKLLLKTTAGVRLITIPPPPAMTPEIAAGLRTLATGLLMGCPALPEWFHGHGRFDLSWIDDPLLDPFPVEMAAGHFWGIEITGLRDGQTAALVDSAGRLIMGAVARAGVPLQLTALLPPNEHTKLSVLRDPEQLVLRGTDEPGGTGSGVQIVRSQSSDLTQSNCQKAKTRQHTLPEQERGIEIQQQPLWMAATVSLPYRCSRVLPLPCLARQGVAGVLDDAIVAIDFSNPYLPKQIRVWRQQGLRGACRWKTGLFAFGVDGFASIDGNLVMSSVGPVCEPRPIVDATIRSGVIYVLTDEALEIRSTKLCPIATLPFEGGRSMIQLGRRLIVGGYAGIAIFDVSDEFRPSLELSEKGLDVSKVVGPPTADTDTFVSLLADGSARMFIADDRKLRATATFSAAPWFADSLRLGNLLVQIGADDRHLLASTIGVPRGVPSLVSPSHRYVSAT